MSALSIQPTYPIFTETDGLPLENGYIWIGAVNLNPITNPIVAYWDSALTIPAVQPIRTSGGYPVYQGTPARIYVNSDYSIQVQNKNGSVVYSAPAATERISSELISFTQAGAGAVQRTAQAKMREVVSVKDFGAVGNGIANDTASIQAAIDYAAPLGISVFIPAGVYSITALTFPVQQGGIELYGEAMNSGSNMQNAVYRGSVLVSTQATGNIISCDGGVFYSNRGISKNCNCST